MTRRVLCLLVLLLFPLGCVRYLGSFRTAKPDISAQCAALPYLAEVGNTILLMPGVPDARKLCVATPLGDDLHCTTVGEFRRRLDTRKTNP